jgi:hypothetical protein
MNRCRALTAAWLAVMSLGLAAGTASADDGEPPGVNDLRLQTERLERAEQADVVGSEASAMLFDPEHRAAALAADEARRRSERAVTAGLFLRDSASSRVPASTVHLFDVEEYARATTSRESGGADDEPGWSGGPFAVLALLAAGAVLSMVLRDRGEHADV